MKSSGSSAELHRNRNPQRQLGDWVSRPSLGKMQVSSSVWRHFLSRDSVRTPCSIAASLQDVHWSLYQHHCHRPSSQLSTASLSFPFPKCYVSAAAKHGALLVRLSQPLSEFIPRYMSEAPWRRTVSSTVSSNCGLFEKRGGTGSHHHHQNTGCISMLPLLKVKWGWERL